MKKDATVSAKQREALRRKKRRKRKLKAFFVVFTIMCLCIGTVLSFTVLFPIKKINITGSKTYSEEEILKACDVKVGDQLLAVNEEKTLSALKKRLPYIKSIVFDKDLSGILNISVKDAKDYACYIVNDRYYNVSKDGWVLSEAVEPDNGVFTVKAEEVKCTVGEEISFGDQVQKELVDRIAAALRAEEIEINGIDVTNTVSLTAYVEGKFEVNLGTSNNIEEKIAQLRVMIKKLGDKKSGIITLSMWTSADPEGTFKEKNRNE